MLGAISGMNWVDVVLLIIMLTGIVDGIRKGALQQIFSIGGVIVALLASPLFCKPLISLLHSVFDGMTDKTANVLGYVLAFILIVWVCSIIGRILQKVVNLVMLGFLDKIVGATLGLVKSLVVIGILMQILNATTLSYKPGPLDNEHSALYQPVNRFTTACLRWSWGRIVQEVDNLDFDKDSDSGIFSGGWEKEAIDVEV